MSCFTASAFAEDLILPNRALVAQNDPVLDASILVAPNLPMEEQQPRATPEPPPVLDVTVPADIPPTVQARQSDRKWKAIAFGGFRVSSTDNLFISATDRRSDVSFQVSPGVALGWGDYEREVRQLGGYERYFEPLNLDYENVPQSFLFAKYNATASFFSENSDENAVDHDALLAGRWQTGKLTLGARLRFQTLSGPDIEVGSRAKRTVYGGEIASSYAFSDKTSLELNLYNRSYDYDQQLDWQEWIVEDWVNYQILPKTRIALGTRFGVAEVESASTQTFEQLVARVMYYPSAKLGLSLDGGVEWRQFGGDSGDDLFSVFNFSASYAPFDGTQLSINAFRRNSASVVYVDENITATGVAARVQQRFLQRYYLAVEGGYEFSDYLSTRTGDGVAREDETAYVKPSLTFDVTKYLSAEAAYQYRRNESSRPDLSFTENVVTFQLNLQF